MQTLNCHLNTSNADDQYNAPELISKNVMKPMIQFFQKLFGTSATQLQKASNNGRKAGQVRFFNRRKGFGFIESPDLDKDIFVHARDLNQSIKKGDEVTFLIGEDSKGPRAVDVALRNGDAS